MTSKTINESIILAGGLGTRLRPLTNYLPKSLLPIANYTMLDWSFSLLSANGISRTIVATNYLGDMIREHIKRVSSKIVPDMEIIVSDAVSKDTADALRFVSGLVQSNNFFILMCDLITNMNLKQLGLFHQEKGGIATLALVPSMINSEPFGVIFLDNDSEIINFLEKPTKLELYYATMKFEKSQIHTNKTNLINSGIYCFKSDIFDILLSEPNLMDFGKDVFPFLLNQGQKLFGFTSDSYWRDCGQPESFIKTNIDILNGKVPYLPELQNKTNIGNLNYYSNSFVNDHNSQKPKSVIIGNDVKIPSSSSINESSISCNTQIGINCNIQGSSIWENVKIGNNVFIKDSLISNGVIIGNNCRIENNRVICPGEIIPENTNFV